MDENMTITVQDIITYLQKFDPETIVYLDKDGWGQGRDTEDVISYVIDDSAVTCRDGNYLVINN